MLRQSKLIKIALYWAVVAFGVSTVVLGIQLSQLSASIEDAKNKLDYMEAQLQGEIKPRHKRNLAQNEKMNYRLPNALKPISYNLYLHPDIDTGNFTGQEKILINVVEVTDQIILHSNKLQISSVYTLESGYDVESYSLDTEREFLVINMKTPLRVYTNVTLGIVFEGQMLNKIVGLYSSMYTTPDNQTRKIATSKFEPTYARQAYPCFDEPNLKAQFEVTLVRPSGDGYHALSNMNERDSLFLGQYTEVYFTHSVPMSTYLTCFIVSDFAFKTEKVEPSYGASFDLRIFATKHQLEKTNFALETAVAVTKYYIKNFKVEYPLPKLDMAAIPDFASNAMEHWGLLTYRETVLLYDRSFSSAWNKQRTAAVIAHELAHMWFGNLVTMNWWNDLWLNEGFARYMEYKAISEVYSDWGLSDQFLVNALHGVMKYDSSVASHPIVQPVENPDQITEIFDTISYEKGASIIRMLEYSVGTEKFEQAVTNYLNRFKFKNTVTDDFLTEVANTGLDFDVKLMMRTWTEQMGLPVVNVKRTSASTFELSQKRFFSNIDDYKNVYDDSEFNYTWTIPLTYIYDHDTIVHRTWFDFDKNSISVSAINETKWLKFNSHQIGFYRVNYEEEMWHAIIKDLVSKPDSFAIADRAHLLNDVFSLADANQLSYEIALDMTRYLSKENDFVPWNVAASQLQALQGNLIFTDSYMNYLQYARRLLEQVYQQVTWNVDEYSKHLENRLRVSILTAACSLGMPDCLEEAASRFTKFLANPEDKPEPDLREVVYYYGMHYVGKQNEWEQLWEIFVKENDANEKLKLMYGLAGTKVPWLLRRFIDLAGNEDYVRRQDYFNCLQNIAGNPVGEPIVWEFVREHWVDLVARFTLNERYMGRMIPIITARFATATKLEEMEAFFDKYPEAGAGAASRQQALETVKYNINWSKNNLEEISKWLAKQ